MAVTFSRGLVSLKQFVVGVAVAVMLTGVAVAGPLEDGEAAYGRGEYATALRLLRPLAEQGDASAQHLLGLMYFHGAGVPQEYVLAHTWLNLSTAQRDWPFSARTFYRDEVASLMTRDQIAEAQRLAREWKPVAER